MWSPNLAITVSEYDLVKTGQLIGRHSNEYAELKNLLHSVFNYIEYYMNNNNYMNNYIWNSIDLLDAIIQTGVV